MGQAKQSGEKTFGRLLYCPIGFLLETCVHAIKSVEDRLLLCLTGTGFFENKSSIWAFVDQEIW